MARILNIDTSTKNCSVCMAINGVPVALREDRNAFDHAKLLTSFVSGLLDESNLSISQLDAIAVSEGPGSYTGLRIGTSVVKGICYGQNLPLLAVGSLHSMAHALRKKYPDSSSYITIMNSRKDELYMAVYSKELQPILAQKPINVKDIEHLNFLNNDCVVAGTGLEKFQSTSLANAVLIDSSLNFSSVNMAPLSFVNFNNKAYKNLIYFEPLYLKSVYAKQINSLPINE